MIAIIISLVYALGYTLCFCMLRIEQEADQEQYTKGDRAACIFISLFSFLAVLGLFIAAWVRMVKATGYWDRPIKKDEVALADNRPFQIQTESLNGDDE